jgi:choline-sulfatase
MKIHPGLLLVIFLFLSANLYATDDRPNILLIMTDQQTAMAMSNTGNPHLHTPAMDQIAARGIRFTQAFSVQPLCKPFRTSLQTGKYPHETGITTNGGEAKPGFEPLGKAMTRAGYEVAYHGKWHVGYPKEDHYDHINSHTNDSAVAARVVDFLGEERNRPFFLTASFTNPHDICQLARALGGRKGNELPQGPIAPFPAIEELPPLPENFEIAKDEPAVIREVHSAEETGGLYPTADYDEITWRKYLWGYYRLAEKVDMEIQKVLEALEGSGQIENTVIIFTSDHGEGVSAHQWNQKCVLYNEVVNVPLIVTMPGNSSGAKVDPTHLVSPAMDIYPTLLELAGASIPDHFDGRSLAPFIWDQPVKDWREYVVLQNTFNVYHSVSSRAIISGNYKYIAYNKNGQPAGTQLFDRINDPGEMKNLAEKRAYKKDMVRLKSVLLDWQSQHKDTEFTLPDSR